MTLVWTIFQANIGKALNECDMICVGTEETQRPQCPVSPEYPASTECQVCQDGVGSQEIVGACPATGICKLMISFLILGRPISLLCSWSLNQLCNFVK